MPTPKDRYVVVRPDGWAVVGEDADRASSRHSTQAEAITRAKEIVGNLGGGEVRIQGRNGLFRDSDTVAPGNDPASSHDRKH